MKIQLDEAWGISEDTYSWKLEEQVEKQREKLDKNKKKTGVKEAYIGTETWYYPKLSMCFETYLEKSLKKVSQCRICKVF